MKIEEIAISELKPAEYNPRIITEDELNGLKESIKKFGIVENILINSDNTVISGHQRIKASEQLGISKVPCYRISVDKKTEKMLNITLNNPNIQGKYNELNLKELLQELSLEDGYQGLRLDSLEPLDLESGDENELAEFLAETEGKETLKIATTVENAAYIKEKIHSYCKNYGIIDEGEALQVMLHSFE